MLLHWAQAPAARMHSTFDASMEYLISNEDREFDVDLGPGEQIQQNATLNFAITDDEQQWTDVVVLGPYGSTKIKDDPQFNALFATCPVVQYVRNGAVMAVYVRTSSIPQDFDARTLFTNDWSNVGNEMGHDFELYDQLHDNQPWQYCNYNDEGIGFPRDCGKDGAISNRWFSMPESKWAVREVNEEGLRFQIFTGSQCPVDPSVLSLPGTSGVSALLR